MPEMNNREYRDMMIAIAAPDESRADDEEARMIVTGYAATFNQPYTLFENDDFIYTEQIAPEAFDGCDMSDVIMQYDHAGRVFARTKNNTLTVGPDDQGLFISADLGGTEIGRNLYEEIRGGYTDKMSFGFTVDRDTETRTDAPDGRRLYLRTIEAVGKLYDVSAVSLPANDNTSITATTRSIRNMVDGVIDQIRTERSEAERLQAERSRTETRARALALERKLKS